MWIKLVLVAFCIIMIAGAIHFKPGRKRTLLATRPDDGPHLRLMTWNIGYAELEPDTRAHTKDLRAIAAEILKNDPDAVALQEMASGDQLKTLLGLLHETYRGSIAPFATTDRSEAVLVKDPDAKFESVPAGGNYAQSATFRVNHQPPDIVLISAHADAFNAARRRTFTGDVMDWARRRIDQADVFVAGDFNFEVTINDESHLYTDNLKHDSEAYSYILKYLRDLGREAGDTAINDRRIDYIFGPVEKVAFRRAEVLRTAAIGRMDHWPLIIDVGF
jgi:endonuclease/exonuclease/phosphatase family metal-dependent hydrolase